MIHKLHFFLCCIKIGTLNVVSILKKTYNLTSKIRGSQDLESLELSLTALNNSEL